MVHILSAQRRDEFLSGNMLCRLEMVLGGDNERHPVLYLKSDYVTAHFIYRLNEMKIRLFTTDNGLICYAVEFDEGLEAPTYMYSSVETLSEKEALSLSLNGQEIVVVLFNDFAIEIGTARALVSNIDGTIDIKSYIPPGPDHFHKHDSAMNASLSKAIEQEYFPCTVNLSLENFRSDATTSVVSRGGSELRITGFESSTVVHELLPQIVTDHTDLTFIHSPNVEVSEVKTREFSDAMFVGGGGIVSFQAKSFLFLDNPPEDRTRATKRLKSNLKKAASQTNGSSRMIMKGSRVFSESQEIEISNDMNIVLSVFVPDMSLIDEEGNKLLEQCSLDLKKRGHHFVVLDPMQLLRTVQAAEALGGNNIRNASAGFLDLLIQRSEEGREGKQFSTPAIYRW